MLSYQRICRPHSSHSERPWTQDSPRMDRKITTLKKLPIALPTTNKKRLTIPNSSGVIPQSYHCYRPSGEDNLSGKNERWHKKAPAISGGS